MALVSRRFHYRGPTVLITPVGPRTGQTAASVASCLVSGSQIDAGCASCSVLLLLLLTKPLLPSCSNVLKSSGDVCGLSVDCLKMTDMRYASSSSSKRWLRHSVALAVSEGSSRAACPAGCAFGGEMHLCWPADCPVNV